MMAALPGGLTFKEIDVVQNSSSIEDYEMDRCALVQRAQDNVGSDEERKKANSALIDTLAELVANGE